MLKRTLVGLLFLLVLAAGGFGTFLYLRSHPSVAAIASAQAKNATDVKLRSDHLDARLYSAACASCHYNAAEGYNEERPNLSANDTITADDPTKLVTIILRGRGSEMPAFAHGFSDADVAMIASYLRATRTIKAPWPELERKVAAIRTALNAKAGATQP